MRPLAGGLIVLLVLGCEPEPSTQTRPLPPPARFERVDPLSQEPSRMRPERVPRAYPPIDPESVEPMEVLYFSKPTGDGYRKAPAQFGPSMHSGKWLGLDNGDHEFLGRRHVIVNHFRNRPDSLGEGELIKNVLLDTDTGEAVAEFAYGRQALQRNFGIALVWLEGDDRPYLLDVETAEFVLAVPEGKHGYVYGENFWLNFSPFAKRMWVTAKDSEGTAHLYAWENLRVPPELPNNPIPAMPREWEPRERLYWEPGDYEEVLFGERASRVYGNDCSRAVLTPPKGFECLDAAGLEDTEPLSDGWRFVVKDNRDVVFNRHTDEGYDLSSLCPADKPPLVSVLEREPPTLRIRCGDDPDVWMKWSPPNRVQKMRPEYARRVNKAAILNIHDEQRDAHVLLEDTPLNTRKKFDWDRMVYELVGTDFDCQRPGFRAASGSPVSVVACSREHGRVVWWVLMDYDKKLRTGRFQATAMAVGRNGVAVAIVRRGDRDHVVRVSVGSNIVQ